MEGHAGGRAYTHKDLEQSLRAMDSLIAKSEKAMTHLAPGTSQHTLLTRRMEAFALARDIISEKLGNLSTGS